MTAASGRSETIPSDTISVIISDVIVTIRPYLPSSGAAGAAWRAQRPTAAAPPGPRWDPPRRRRCHTTASVTRFLAILPLALPVAL
jgi:hypothetical protein